MQQFRLIGLALMAVFAMGVIAASTASAALPVILNQKKEVVEKGVLFKGLFTGATELERLNGTKIECKETHYDFHFETGPLGLFHIHFLKCTGPLGVTCTGLGDTEAGTILVLGTFHIVYDSLTTLGAAVLFLLEPVHFTCLTTLIDVSGQVLCLVTPINTQAKKFTVKCEQAGGDPKEVVYWNDEGKEVNIKEGLLSGEDGGLEMAGEGGTTEVEGIEGAETVEIMA